jgi:hypothetical protein
MDMHGLQGSPCPCQHPEERQRGQGCTLWNEGSTQVGDYALPQRGFGLSNPSGVEQTYASTWPSLGRRMQWKSQRAWRRLEGA